MGLFPVLLTLTGLLVACGTDSPGRPEDPEIWRISTDPVSTQGLAWASGSTVHLGDGSTIETVSEAESDTGSDIASFVVAGDGVYFLESGGPDYSPSRGDIGELRYADRSGRVVDTGLKIDAAASLRASPDGRYLAAFDMGSGEEDDFGTHQAALVVWDLHEGEEIVRSTEGMGDPETDDFAVLYGDAGIFIADLTDQDLYVAGATDNLVYDLTTGESRVLPDDEQLAAPDLYRVSPDHEWTLVDGGRDRSQVVEGPDGHLELTGVAPRKLTLYGWTTGGALLAVRDGEPQVAMTCAVPSGRCTELPGTAGRNVVFENAETGPTGLDLRPGTGR